MMTTTFRRTAAAEMNDRRPRRPADVSTSDARQGVTGHNVRYVLGVSTAVAAFVLAVLWFFYFTG